MRASKTCRRAFTAIAALSLSVSSCDVFSGFSRPEDSGAAFVRFVEPVDGTLDLSLYATDPDRKAYVVFTTGKPSGAQVPSASLSSVRSVSSPITEDKVKGVNEMASEKRRSALRNAMASFVSIPSPRYASTGDPDFDELDKTESFTMYGDIATTNAICKYVSGPINIGNRSRSLSIWVETTEWSDVETIDGKVTPEKIAVLAKSFFNAEINPEDSIYYWVTNMLGNEWGPEGSILYRGYTFDTLGETKNITLLLADIDKDTTDFTTQGGVAGYFYPGDLIPSFDYSNQRVMFTIDSVMLGTKDGATWDFSDYWPREVISTLAHEFQHMIHFYQKGVVAGADLYDEPTWIDELCSMQVEDLIADKMGVPGPRGINPYEGTAGIPGNHSGRLAQYLLYPDFSLEEWPLLDDPYVIYYYSLAYSFGAYLTRNYGGAEFIRNVVQSKYADERSVVAGAMAGSGREESMTSLLRRWGAAVLLSSRMDAPEFYRYNTGQFFTSEFGGISYNLGSINMYNYVYADGLDTDGDDTGDTDLNGPYIYDSLNIGDMYGGAYSNAFMTLGNPSTRPDWKLTVPEGMYATIVID